MKTNPFAVGDYVTHVYGGNGTGEGILWRVAEVKVSILILEPAWTVSGPSVRRRRKSHWVNVKRFDLVEFGQAIRELQSMAHDRYKTLSGIPVDEQLDTGSPDESAPPVQLAKKKSRI